jgi:chromatin remodeling complex protein RSC6
MPSKKDTKTESVEQIFGKFNEIVDNLSNFKTQITSLQQQLKLVEKNVKKQMNQMIKTIEKNKNKNKGNRKPSGFAKPSKVTKELCHFMNKTEGTEIARTEVTKTIVNYIKTNNLQNKENNKVIHPDEKLKDLLVIDDNEELTYFTLQKYMNKHFVSKTLDADK